MYKSKNMSFCITPINTTTTEQNMWSVTEKSRLKQQCYQWTNVRVGPQSIQPDVPKLFYSTLLYCDILFYSALICFALHILTCLGLQY